MQPRRKEEERVDAAPAPEAAPVERDFVPATGDAAASPALALQAELAARLVGSTPDTIEQSEVKWPMPLRIATILTLSIALWAGIVLTAVAVITK